jgi:hypothetical protein
MPGVMILTCNSSTEEVETGGLQVWGQPELHSKILCQKTPKTNKQKDFRSCFVNLKVPEDNPSGNM